VEVFMLALERRVVEPLWAGIESLLPRRPVDTHPLGCHRRRVADKTCFIGILARLVTGCSWAVAGTLVGVGETTLRRRRTEWLHAGVFTRIAEAALAGYERIIGLQLDEIAIDGSVHKAPMGGEGTGPSHVDRSKLGWKWSIATEANGIPVAWVCAGANIADVSLVHDTFDAIEAHGYEQDITTIHLDRGYDSTAIRELFTDVGIEAHIPQRQRSYRRRRKRHIKPRNRIPLGQRWKVERANSWLSNFGQLRRSTDRKPIHREAALDLAVACILTAKLVKWHNRYGPTIYF
jgi:transposase